ncbi:hypothetical protein GmHk_17G050124 [Glycine max]|nr:hypothetical protein GmHk_17G050124 [Glycine max]
MHTSFSHITHNSNFIFAMDAGYTNAWFDVVVYENQVSHSWMLGNLESLKVESSLKRQPGLLKRDLIFKFGRLVKNSLKRDSNFTIAFVLSPTTNMIETYFCCIDDVQKRKIERVWERETREWEGKGCERKR